MGEHSAGRRLRVDPIACDGVGICAHLAPDAIHLDTWGYPIVSGEPLTGRAERQADAAVAACPQRALYITR